MNDGPAAAAAALRALAPTPFVTLQDGGRQGWKRFGVSGAGAMDAYGLAAANALVGNAPHLGALEFAYGAGTWVVEAASCRIAVAGGNFPVHADDRRIPPWTSATLRRGQTLRVDGAADAVWGYLAAAGGFAVAPQLGSVATHLRSGIGGFEGRTLRAGDRLPLVAPAAPDEPERRMRLRPAAPSDPVMHAVLGPQDDYFTAEAVHALFTEAFGVTVRCDRLGYRLAGPAVLAHAKGADIISDGVVPGSIQVPGDGQPIVLMQDAQPPGGYPKIATVVAADLARIAQTPPGRPILFRQVGIAEAQLLRQRFLAELAQLPSLVTPLADAADSAARHAERT